jgi:tetratricopeptide (TPR) repeat protein
MREMNRIHTIPLEAQYLCRAGLELVERGRYEQALRKFRQALIVAPGYARAQLEAGNCLSRLGRVEERSAYHREAAGA